MSSHHLLIIFGSNSVWNSLCNNIRHLGLFLAPPPTVRVAVGDGTLALVSRLASMRFLPSVRVLMVVALCGYPLIGNLYNFILRLPNLAQLITKNCILPHDIGIWFRPSFFDQRRPSLRQCRSCHQPCTPSVQLSPKLGRI